MINEVIFEEIVKSHCREWQSAAFRVTGNSFDSDDIVQSALLAAWQARENFSGNAQFSSFVYRIVIHKAIDFVRKETARRRREKEVPTLQTPPTYGKLYEAIAQLPEPYAQVVTTLLANNMSYSATAKILALPETTLYSRMHRTKELLEKILK